MLHSAVRSSDNAGKQNSRIETYDQVGTAPWVRVPLRSGSFVLLSSLLAHPRDTFPLTPVHRALPRRAPSSPARKLRNSSSSPTDPYEHLLVNFTTPRTAPHAARVARRQTSRAQPHQIRRCQCAYRSPARGPSGDCHLLRQASEVGCA